MKKLLSLMALAGVLVGCSTTQRTETCQTAQAALATYLAVVQAGGTPSASEIQIAAGATAFLTAYCGWTSPGAGTRSAGQVDRYGVPVVVPPGFKAPAGVTSTGDWAPRQGR